MEVVGVASILPFMELIANPDAINQSSKLSEIYERFNFDSHRQMLIYFGIGIVIVIAITNIFAIFTVWLQYKLSWAASHNLSTRLLRTYIRKPYSFFLNANSSNLVAYIISEVNMLTGGIIIPIIEFISRIFVSLVIFALLIIVDAKIAFVMFIGLGGAYGMIYLAQKNILKRIGEYRMKMNLGRFQSLQEFFNGIKTISVYNKQEFFFDRFSYNSSEFCNVQPKYNLMLAAPRYLLELVAFGSILSVTIYLFIHEGDVQSALPRLSLYAVAGYRLLPSLQKAFAAAAKIKHNYPVLNKLHEDLKYSLTAKYADDSKNIPLDFNLDIKLDHLSFKYEGIDQHVIDDLNISIKKGETIAFIGSTGSGKTTLIDMVVGLLTPIEGAILVDGKPLNKKRTKNWRSKIAYVPQEVFLFDDSVIKNITLGEKKKNINFDKLYDIMKTTDIYDFVMDMPEGLDTMIGERGLRLSGGQRQRIGLARALYSDPSILVLDEATSALDSITEKGIIDSLQSLPQEITTLIIAHRLSTVKHADCIYFLDKGKIASKGDYESLMESSDTFKTMVKLS